MQGFNKHGRLQRLDRSGVFLCVFFVCVFCFSFFFFFFFFFFWGGGGGVLFLVFVLKFAFIIHGYVTQVNRMSRSRRLLAIGGKMVAQADNH